MAPAGAAVRPAPAWWPVAREHVAAEANRVQAERQPSAVRESLAIFGLVFAVFLALGLWITVQLQAVPFDAAFRLTHAYAALHNDPAKLAAIGFVWPPLMTLVYLPLVAIKPMATSLVALPLNTALIAGLFAVVVNRTFVLVGMGRALRYGLLIAFLANPLVVHYATNGMAEILTFLLLALALHQFLSWSLRGESHHLALCGLFMGLGYLARYEMAPYAAALFLAVLAILTIERRADKVEIEGSLLLYAAPVAYAVGAWVLFNWLIAGDPLYFLQREVQERFVLEGGRAVSEGGAGGAAMESWSELARQVADVNWQVLAAQFVVLPLLLIVGAIKRNVIAFVLVGLMLVNPLTTAVFVHGSDLSLLQLRFNMRTMPLVLVGAAWLFLMLRGSRARTPVAVAITLAIVASAPLSWHAMKSYPYVFGERDFVAAVETGERQDPLGLEANRPIADYVNEHVTRHRAVLVDDAQTFVPIMIGGRPQLYYDRIDKGDEEWNRVLQSPRGRVDYLLMPTRQGVIPDKVHERWAGALDGKVPFLEVVHESGDLALVRVQPAS